MYATLPPSHSQLVRQLPVQAACKAPVCQMTPTAGLAFTAGVVCTEAAANLGNCQALHGMCVCTEAPADRLPSYLHADCCILSSHGP